MVQIRESLPQYEKLSVQELHAEFQPFFGRIAT
jgi:hypothetical protein